MMVLSTTCAWAHTNMGLGLPGRSRIVSGLRNLDILNSGSTLERTTGFSISCLQGRRLERLATSAMEPLSNRLCKNSHSYHSEVVAAATDEESR